MGSVKCNEARASCCRNKKSAHFSVSSCDDVQGRGRGRTNQEAVFLDSVTNTNGYFVCSRGSRDE